MKYFLSTFLTIFYINCVLSATIDWSKPPPTDREMDAEYAAYRQLQNNLSPKKHKSTTLTGKPQNSLKSSFQNGSTPPKKRKKRADSGNGLRTHSSPPPLHSLTKIDQSHLDDSPVSHKSPIKTFKPHASKKRANSAFSVGILFRRRL